MKRILSWMVAGMMVFPLSVRASFIEATMGTAVVNDATAALYNPGALLQVKTPQLIGLGTIAFFRTSFVGQATQLSTHFTQSGSSTTESRYYLPSLYFGVPLTDKVVVGAAVVSNIFNRDIDSNAILRYMQSNNAVQDIDFLPAIGIALTPSISIGANLNISHASFDLRPIFGMAGLDIPDSQGINTCDGTSWGGDAGIFVKPWSGAAMGLNYRSAIEYHLRGKSVLAGNPPLISRDYHFTFWTPARTVFSIAQRLTQRFGMIGTAEFIQWDIFKNVKLYNFAASVGGRPVIVPFATIPFHFHNGWLLTLGGLWQITPAWVLRVAGSYVESPTTGHFQVDTGDSFNLAFSTGYEINRHFTLDGGYAHSFVQPQHINIMARGNIVTGVNRGYRNAVSLKLTVNF